MPKRKQESPKKKKTLTFEQLHMPNKKPPSPEDEPTPKWHEGPWSVPSGIYLALGSGRPELVKLAIGDVERGDTEVSKQLVTELMRLVADCMVALRKAEDEIEGRVEELKAVGSSIHAAKVALHDASSYFSGGLTADSE